MNVHRDSLNGMIYAKITPIFGTVKSYIENYNTYKKFRFQREFLNVNYICTRFSRMSTMNRHISL